ncbi:MAG: histone deacetylase family protein [Candidatus Helarchaeota archaeon]
MVKTGIVYSDEYLKHETGTHVESKERLIATMKLLNERKIFDNENIELVEPEKASVEDIKLVHQQHYIERIEDKCKSGGGWLDGDTTTSKDTYEVALYASGGVNKAARMIMKGDINNAICLVRPPGHHAREGNASGFCIFNNIAICARYLLKNFDSVKKVLIYDHDAHAGNGTSYTFFDQSEVLMFNFHQHPRTLYPGTCYLDEVGEGEGKGYNFNMTMAPGSGEKHYLKIMDEILHPLIQQYNPDFILVSAGFDSHKNDPITSLGFTVQGYGKIIKKLKTFAEEICEGRLLITLEGGYNLDAISQGIYNEIMSLSAIEDYIEDDEPHYSKELDEYTDKLIKETKDIFKEFWKF